MTSSRQKTTYPPVVMDGGGGGTIFTTNLTLSPQAPRDTGTPAPGYHYDVLDYAIGSLDVSNAVLTVEAGVVICGFSHPLAFSDGAGLTIDCRARGLFTGTPVKPILFGDYTRSVGEQTANAWYAPTVLLNQGRGVVSPDPVIQCRFVNFSTARDAFDAWWSSFEPAPPPNFQDCWFHGGRIFTEYLSANFTNCLFERVNVELSCQDLNAPAFRNNLFLGGHFSLFAGYDATLKDNLFDKATISDSGTYVNDHNGYVSGYDKLSLAPGTGDVTLGASPAYQIGPLGSYYYPTNLALVNAGSTNANRLGLYHYTTTTNQVKETNSMVDIGYHYVAVNTNGTPFDTDGGGGPDYLEDANGNGTVDAGESDWTAGHGADDYHVILSPEYLRCEYRQNPWGINAPTPGTTNQHPRLYWTVKSDRRFQMQRAYQILVAGSEANLNANYGDLWDSGKVLSDQTTHVEYNGATLQSNMRLWWKVRTWDKYYDLPSAWSTNAFWQMGLLSTNDWQAQWLTTATDPGSSVTPMYRKTFVQLTNDIKRATVYVSAKGVYELWINGARIGQNVLAPEWTSYTNRIQYQTFDVTTNLLSTNSDGTNHVIGAFVGEGWYSGPQIYNSISFGAYTTGHDKQFLVQLIIENNDGTTNTVVTDNSWKCYEGGPIQRTSIYDGETYDARQEGSITLTGQPIYIRTKQSILQRPSRTIH